MNIRLAESGESQAAAELVNAAYAKYIERIGRKPLPMLADYAALIAKGVVYVIPGDGGGIQAVLVIYPEDNSLLIENIAVHPSAQKRGLGQALMAFAEQQAREKHLTEVRLY